MRDAMELRIAHLSTLYHTSLILMSNDIGARLGVHVTWRLFGTGPAMLDAFDKGEVDLGYMGLPPAIIGISRGLRMKCIAGGHVEGTVLVARNGFKPLRERQSVAETLKQFEGKTIAVPQKGCIHDVIIRSYAKGLRVAIKNFEWADFIPEALERSEVEAAAGTPALAVAASIACGARIIVPPSKLWPYNPSYGIIASGELIKEHPHMLEQFLRLHEDACALIRNDPKRAARIASKTVDFVDEDFALRVFGISPRYCASLPAEYIKSTMACIPTMIELGYIRKAPAEKDIFDRSFITRVHPRPAHY